MIQVLCAECGETFEVGDEFAGLTEFCPSCGALNNIPDPESLAEETPVPEETPVSQEPAPAEPALHEPLGTMLPPPRGGMPAGIWWTLLISSITFFVIACVYLFSSSWEDRNIQTLSNASNLGDVLMSDEDYAGAERQYRFVLDTVDHRSIDSAFIIRLIDHARRGEADADIRMHALPATAPATQIFPTTRSPEEELHFALRAFQRDYESFAAFVPAHAILFQDDKSDWRRRQYFLWQLAYDPPTAPQNLTILLRYDLASHITEPHADQQDAERDDNFIHDETPGVVHCQTHLEWLGGQWVIVRHDADSAPLPPDAINLRASLDDFYPIERRAFHAAQPTH